jgi:hypothetical protein
VERFLAASPDADTLLSDTDFGYALLDAMAQANIDYRNMSLDEMKSMLVAFCRRQRIAALSNGLASVA